MKQTKLIMGMPITIEIIDDSKSETFDKIFNYFTFVDKKFSTYKKSSEISKINLGKISDQNISQEMKEVFNLANQTKKDTHGFFDISRNGSLDPSGIVKGWAILNAAKLLLKMGYENFYIDAGGDIQTSGRNSENKDWVVGIKNPFNEKEIIKVLKIKDQGVATSGTYIRGEHIYNPKGKNLSDSIVSITIIGPNVYEADRFATASFAMGKKGIEFIEKLNGFEGYMIDKEGIATMTTGFGKYTI